VRSRRALLILAACLGCNKAPGPAHCPDYQALKNVYFGDMHVHTSYSFDAFDYGTRSDPAAAYAFARGASVDVVPTINVPLGQTQGPLGVKITTGAQKLDFMAVTDHAEFLGSQHGCIVDQASGFYDNKYCASLRGAPDPNFEDMTHPSWVQGSPCLGPVPNGAPGDSCTVQTRLAWKDEQQAANAANAPCEFTTLHGFEWTGVDLGSQVRGTLHRNVIFKNDNVPEQPLDFLSYPTIRHLWAGLDSQCTEANGCSAITIPHNSNQSQGKMFDLSGFSADDLDRMTRYQLLVEIHQSKGNSECLNDTADNGAVTACDFEIETGDTNPAYQPGYVRPALESGLGYFAAHGQNPLMLGFIGDTDTHNATPGNVGEANWPGHVGVLDNTPLLRLQSGIAGQNPGGITGVWAEENTRDSIFGALQRREVFATSGPRIKLRFYATSGASDPCSDPSFPSRLVAAGAVPMGGVIQSAPAPQLVLYALADQTPLEAVDFVKATVSRTSTAVIEKIHTVAFNGAPYCLSWTDPEADAALPALYYARVREKPTPRWSHYDCQALKQSNPADWQTLVPGCVPTSTATLDTNIEERAWTSPIWYLPKPAKS
jgi:hypothetical protein